jgi:hypothetical protein
MARTIIRKLKFLRRFQTMVFTGSKVSGDSSTSEDAATRTPLSVVTSLGKRASLEEIL